MIKALRMLLMNLPIVRILRHHHNEQCESACLKETLRQESHEIARRVHVIEWQTFPRTHERNETRDDH